MKEAQVEFVNKIPGHRRVRSAQLTWLFFLWASTLRLPQHTVYLFYGCQNRRSQTTLRPPDSMPRKLRD